MTKQHYTQFSLELIIMTSRFIVSKSFYQRAKWASKASSVKVYALIIRFNHYGKIDEPTT